MKKSIFLFPLVFTLGVTAQTPKGLESSEDPDLTREQREELEEAEDLKIRKQWDREEQEAQAREEKQRRLDEERAERD